MHPILHKDITFLKKVGPLRAEALAQECGIRTYEDLLYYYPRKYVDRSEVTKICHLSGEEQQVSLVGKINRSEIIKSKRGRGRLTAQFGDGSGFVELNWFQGVKWMQKNLPYGVDVAIFGKLTQFGGKFQISHPEIEVLSAAKKSNSATPSTPIVPFYSSTEKLGRLGLDSRGFRQLVKNLFLEIGPHLQENLSEGMLEYYALISRKEALKCIHFPSDLATLSAAQHRLKFEEFFFFQLMLARKRKVVKSQHPAPPFTLVGDYFNNFFREHLPFELTAAQKRVMKEVRKDLALAVQMNRLIQGDVGSGKTMIAFLTMLLAKDNGFQSAFMAPTAILAEQHVKKLGVFAQKMGLEVDLLVGGQKKKEREEILERLASGKTDITVGTHALIEDHVAFKRLGLVVVDEQHKFGVLQRARLWRKANPFPHNMVMTATPIPRTLAMTVYGDIDVSVIDELPPGRKPIHTRMAGESKRLEVFGFIRNELLKGRQAYVVYPLVEESEKLDYLAAVKGHELLEQHFHEFRVGIVHGQMKAEDKEMEMQRFVRKETQIMVSTTVIEVGVDVPNATIMVIENAERFGLSQLHQLRGRVGRSTHQSYCVLMMGYKVSREGKARLKAMTDTNDGFKIAEIDLQLRGPGDFLGTRQSGLPEFQLANIAEDQSILQLARQAAFHIVETDPFLDEPANYVIKKYYEEHARKIEGLSSIA